MNDLKIGGKALYNNETYDVAGFEGKDLVVLRRTGSSFCVTVPLKEVSKILEEGKDTNTDRVAKKLNG